MPILPHTQKEQLSFIHFIFPKISSQEKYPRRLKKNGGFEQRRLSRCTLRQVQAGGSTQVMRCQAHLTIPAPQWVGEGGRILQPRRPSLVTVEKEEQWPQRVTMGIQEGTYLKCSVQGQAKANAEHPFAGLHPFLRLEASPRNLSSV